MSLKDIFEWIINVNLFYVFGVILFLVIVGNLYDNGTFEKIGKYIEEHFFLCLAVIILIVLLGIQLIPFIDQVVN